jgi:hypothetical protein
MNSFDRARELLKGSEPAPIIPPDRMLADGFLPEKCMLYFAEQRPSLEVEDGQSIIDVTINDESDDPRSYRILWNVADPDFVNVLLGYNLNSPELERPVLVSLAHYMTGRWKVGKVTVDRNAKSVTFSAEMLVSTQEEFNHHFPRISNILCSMSDEFFRRIF